MIAPMAFQQNPTVAMANPNAQAMLQQFMQGGNKQIPNAPQNASATKAGTPLNLQNQGEASLNVLGGTGLKMAEGESPKKALAQDPGYLQYLRLTGRQNVAPAPTQSSLQNNAPPINWSSLMAGQGMGQ